MALRPDLQEFPGISRLAFQHPLDIQALGALERVPLLPMLTRKLSEVVLERFIRVQNVSSNLRLSEDQYPSLYRQYCKMARVLDIPTLPDLYIDSNPVINAYAMGMKNYFIVVNSGLIELLTEDELLAVIAHELGHVKCEHMLYVTMANLIRTFGTALLDALLPGVGQLASLGLQLALLEWYRKAEFSCDRAALLATQKGESVQSVLAKLGGYSPDLEEDLNIAEVIHQADDYEDLGANSLVEKVIKLYVLLGETHPFPVVRTKEIASWVDSDEYLRILSGQYQRQPAVHTFGPGSTAQPFAAAPQPRCPHCGTPARVGAVFCSECGQSLNPPADNAPKN